MYAQYNDFLAIRFMPGTKISHDYSGNDVKTFSYRDLASRKGVPAIGIPCRQNNLIVIDVDVKSEQHKHDGRDWWANFCSHNHIPQTYTVQTASGGYHFYFALPAGLNPDGFRPPAALAPGVDVKFNGWVGAPPTPGYKVLWGDITKVHEAPPTLMAAFSTAKEQPTFEVNLAGAEFNAHRPFTEHQIKELKEKIDWLQKNSGLSRSEWRDGLFALKAGINDPELLEELAIAWTMNQSFNEGDEHEAISIVERADKYGPIGPGTIFSILKSIAIREGASNVDSQYSFEEILTRSKVPYSFSKDGSLKIATTETNAGAIIGAMYNEKELYHDVRSDQYVFKGEVLDDVELSNKIIPRMQSSNEGLGLEKFRKAVIKSGLEILMANRQRDPHIEFLQSVEWDGKDRIETFFQRHLGVLDDEYHRAVSKNFWVALAARGLRPGIKFDAMLILEGKEGIRKSSLVEAIGGQYTFAPSRKDAMENMDELRKMHQSVVVELPELMGLVNQPAERVKAFMAAPYDHIRDLYARKATKRDRGFVFIGTTNSSEYLHLDMGQRRFWPVKVPDHITEINIDKIIQERDQLFAEAKKYFYDSYPFYTIDPKVLSKYTEQKVVTDPLDYVINEMIKEENVTSVNLIYKRLEAGGYINRGLGSNIKTRITATLRRLKFAKSGNSGDSYTRVSEDYSPALSYNFSEII